MNKYFIAATSGILAGASLLLCTAPATAHEGLAVSIGVPLPLIVAPAPYISPPPIVYGGYGPVVQYGSPYYYGAPYYYGRGWYDHGYGRGWYGHGYRGNHDGHRGSRR